MTIAPFVFALQASPRRDGRYHAVCPFCRRAPIKHARHFAFSDRGYRCTACHAKGSLKTLALYVNVSAE